ncbi:MAG: tetratricopeptide repeat protein [Planctomycetaceae bacterium]|nr:tetratricopeptide repeat protein [Planctomycetaceae bacterium]
MSEFQFSRWLTTQQLASKPRFIDQMKSGQRVVVRCDRHSVLNDLCPASRMIHAAAREAFPMEGIQNVHAPIVLLHFRTELLTTVSLGLASERHQFPQRQFSRRRELLQELRAHLRRQPTGLVIFHGCCDPALVESLADGNEQLAFVIISQPGEPFPLEWTCETVPSTSQSNLEELAARWTSSSPGKLRGKKLPRQLGFYFSDELATAMVLQQDQSHADLGRPNLVAESLSPFPAAVHRGWQLLEGHQQSEALELAISCWNTAELPTFARRETISAMANVGFIWTGPFGQNPILPPRIAREIVSTQSHCLNANRLDTFLESWNLAVRENPLRLRDVPAVDALISTMLRLPSLPHSSIGSLTRLVQGMADAGCGERADELFERLISKVDGTELTSQQKAQVRKCQGRALVSCERYAAAGPVLAEAVEINSQAGVVDIELDLDVAEVSLLECQNRRALSTLQRVERQLRSNDSTRDTGIWTRFRYLQGACLLAMNRAPEAVRVLSASLADREAFLDADSAALSKHRILLARGLFAERRTEEAELILRKDLQIRESLPGASRFEQAVPISLLAELYCAQGRTSAAEPLLRRLWELRRTHLDSHDPLIAEAASRLASVISSNGAFHEAVPLFREAVSRVIQTFGTNHPETAKVNNDLAESLLAAGKTDQARRLLERSLRIQEQTLRANDPAICRTRNNLAATYVAERQLDAAEKLYRRDLAVKQEAVHPNLLSIAVTLNNLGEVVQAQGRVEDAKQFLRESLTLRKDALPATHPHYAQSLNNYGSCLLMAGQIAEAEPLLSEALEIRRKNLPDSHPQLIASLLSCSEARTSTNRLEAARELLEDAVRMGDQCYGNAHPQLAQLWVRLGHVYIKTDHIARGELLLLKAKTLLEKTVESGHRFRGELFHALGELRQTEGRLQDAFLFLEQADAVLSESTPANRQQLAEIRNLLGRNLLQRNQAELAELQFRKSRETMEELRLRNHPAEVTASQGLAEALTYLQKYQEAETLLRELATQRSVDQEQTPEQHARICLQWADVLIGMQEFPRARRLLEELLMEWNDCRERDQELLETRTLLMALALATSDYSLAEKQAALCLALTTQLNGSHSPSAKQYRENLEEIQKLVRPPSAESRTSRSHPDTSANAENLPRVVASRIHRVYELLPHRIPVRTDSPRSALDLDDQATGNPPSVNRLPDEDLSENHVLDDIL